MAVETSPVAPLANDRSLLFGAGAVSIVIGIILLVWPEASVTVFAVLLGINFLVLGLIALAASFVAEASIGERILGAVLGVLSLLVAVALFSRPLQTVALVVVVIGAFWIVGGVIEIVTGLFGRTAQSRWLSVGGGVLSVVFGAVLLSWPGPTVAVVVLLTGIWCVLWGAVQFYRGFRTPRAVTAA